MLVGKLLCEDKGPHSVPGQGIKKGIKNGKTQVMSIKSLKAFDDAGGLPHPAKSSFLGKIE